MKKLLTAAFLITLAGLAVASEEDELTSLSYISYLERYATVQPSTQQDSVEAVINMPLVPGDRIDTAREARMEIFLSDGNTVWLDEYSTLSLDAVAFSRDTQGDRTVLFLADGTAMVEISKHRLNPEPIRIDGQSATVYLNATGLYRVQALPAGGLRLEVWEGLAEASTSAGGVLVRAESAAEVGDGQIMDTEPNLTWGDDFAHWVEQRRQFIEGESSQYVEARYGRQAAQLDNYGNWVYVESHNTWAWQPHVSAGWQPYTAGRWYWTPTGWSWVSYEPWGWLPYHYGSWYFTAGYGWTWSWHRYWSPAWVTWAYWPGYVGWCPYGYYWGWYWPRYGHYYGYHHWPYHGGGGHGGGGHGGGGYDQPPRRDVIPRPGSGRAEPGDGARLSAASRPHEVALDLEGRVRVADMDRAGWNVVADRDFASPHLPRLVERGDVALRDLGDQVGVVTADPLTTAPPSRVRASNELRRVFGDIEQRATRDLTPVLARDDSLRGEDALRLVEPTTVADISRRSASRAPAVRPSLTTDADSPIHTRTIAGTPSSSSPYRSPDGATTRTRTGQTASRNPFVPPTRPSTVAPSTGSRTWRSPGTTSAPTRRSPVSSPPVQRSVPPTTGRSRSSGPVVLPNTAPSRPSRRVGASSPSTRPPSSARSPSSAGRYKPAPSSRPPSRSSGMRSPSSGRASPGRTAAPRSAPRAAPRSSGKASRK